MLVTGGTHRANILVVQMPDQQMRKVDRIDAALELTQANGLMNDSAALIRFPELLNRRRGEPGEPPRSRR